MAEVQDPWPVLKGWFPEISDPQWDKLQEYTALLREWNAKINLVSRKDMDRLETKHLAHCLTITKFLRLMPRARLLDVGTGGGLPGIPMAICYPQAKFTLMDSIAKKTMVVEDIAKRLNLENVEVRRGRVEELPKKKTYDFVLGSCGHCPASFFRMGKGQGGKRIEKLTGKWHSLPQRWGLYRGIKVVRTHTCQNLES